MWRSYWSAVGHLLKPILNQAVRWDKHNHYWSYWCSIFSSEKILDGTIFLILSKNKLNFTTNHYGIVVIHVCSYKVIKFQCKLCKVVFISKNCWQYSYWLLSCYICTWWLGGSVVRALDSGPRGRQFDSRPVRYQVTTLSKLFTPTCLCRCTWSSGGCRLVTFRLRFDSRVICKQPWASC